MFLDLAETKPDIVEIALSSRLDKTLLIHSANGRPSLRLSANFRSPAAEVAKGSQLELCNLIDFTRHLAAEVAKASSVVSIT